MIIHGDCLEKLKELPDNSVEMVLTSPPYDDLRAYQGLSFEQFQVVAKELYRLVKPGGVVVWIVGDQCINGSESGTSFRQVLYFKDTGFRIHDTMIWQKFGGPFPETVRYYQNFEYMFVLSKGAPSFINLLADRENVTSGRKIQTTDRQKDGTTRPSSHHKTHPSGKYVKPFGVRYNVWKMSNHSRKETKHPAAFPVSLVEDHLKTWCPPGGIVLDPFFGSGTTGVAAKRLGFKFIGIERESEYVEIASRRIMGA